MSNPAFSVVSAVCKAIGIFGSTSKDVSLSELTTTAVRAPFERCCVLPDTIAHLAMGKVIPTEPRLAYLSRVAAIQVGFLSERQRFNVNRLGIGGRQGIASVFEPA